MKWTEQNGAWVISTLPYPGSGVARGIDDLGNVVGYGATSPSGSGTNTGFFWSLSTGMLQLPANRWGGANAMSDVRSDGSRLVVGTDSQANAVVWVVRVP